MDLKWESFDIYGSTVEIVDYIDRFNFLIDTRKTSDAKAILMAVEKKAFTLLKPISTVREFVVRLQHKAP